MGAGDRAVMRVTVVCALPARARRVALEVAPGTTLRQTIEKSGIPVQAPLRLGVFGRVCEPEAVVADGDRIEIYRALVIDPKDARRQRARRK